MTQPHLSLNGTPGILWEIRRQENVHPYLGIRQAILIANAQEKALKEGRLAQKKAQLELKHQKQKLLVTEESDERDILLDEIDLAEHNATSSRQLILDAQNELNVALAEKSRIESLNPDMVSSDYEELQQTYAKEAFQCKLARAVIISAYSSQKMISEGAAEVIYDSACFSETERRTFEANLVNQFNHWLPSTPDIQAIESTNGGDNELIFNGN